VATETKAQGKRAKDKICLMLTDVEMPEMDGFTLTRNIKADRRFDGIPVVIHSSLTGATNENLVKSVGADAYVAKFMPREFASAIRGVMEKVGK
jgi:two-component system chemotaxis response regulator CheV